jgi:hypothetical protein
MTRLLFGQIPSLGRFAENAPELGFWPVLPYGEVKLNTLLGKTLFVW